MQDDVVGREVDGYRILDVLGRGGMGTVYKAEDVNLSRTVALKRINPGQQHREMFIHRFRSEAKALARINSSYIVGIYALRDTEIGLLIVMEYVDGGTIKDRLGDGPMEPGEAIPLLKQMLTAFADAHDAGVVHRDIKPQNIMISSSETVKITDFGIAKMRQQDSGETVTQGGQGGTLKYMSPEQISSIDDVDERSDLYSIGMTAYEMLAGQLPFEETDTDFDIMQKVVEGKIPPPNHFNTSLPPSLVDWVTRATAKKQGDRYPDADVMLEALQAAERDASSAPKQPLYDPDDDTATVLADDDVQTVLATDDATTLADDAPPSGSTAPPSSGPGDDATVAAPAGETTPSRPTASPASSAGSPSDDEGDTAPAATPDTASDDASGGLSPTLIAGGLVVILLLLGGGYFALSGDGGSAASTISLTTTPASAVVYVEGDSVGTTPLTDQPVTAGTVALRVEREGRVPFDTLLQVTAGQSVVLGDVALARVTPEGEEDAPPQAIADASGSETDAPATDAPATDDSGSDEAPASRETASDAASPSSDASTPGESGDSASEETTEAAEEAPAPTPTGTVAVSAQPTGTILVGGKEGRGSASFALSEGRHTLRCRHTNYGTIETQIEVSAGTETSHTCYFEREVNVSADAWGNVWVNGQNTGESTPAAISLGPGEHRIELRITRNDDFTIPGGIYRYDTGTRGTERFDGNAHTISLEPGFQKQKHAVAFTVKQ